MGKPPWGNAQGRPTESIGWTEDTEGTETSKYLEEKRTFRE
jgi:hypothetical protein